MLEIEGLDDNSLADTFAKVSVWPQFKLFRRQALLALKGENPSGSLLDVGCGGGWFLKDIHRALPKIALTGCDLSERMVQNAERNLKGKAKIYIGDAQNLPFESGTFDVVTSTLAFHHFPEPLKALTEFYRILKPSGLMVVSDFRRDCAGWFCKLIKFIGRYILPKKFREVNEPLGSIMAAFTLDEYNELMKQTSFHPWEIISNSYQATLVGRKS